MLCSLHLKNFRKHADTQVNFTEGLNVIRGPNEIGKTTLIEAALYALYGAKSLRDPLAKTVTWGKKESELSVKLVIRISGKDYTFTRSKAGAEVNAEGIKVTGQAEVSAYAAELLGADAKVANMLMLASQSGLRGALDEGPAAVSALMGRLADFDLIDRIIETASQSLSLGSEMPLQEKVTAAEKEFEALNATLAQPSDKSALEAARTLVLEDVKRLSAETTKLQAAVVDADKALSLAKTLIEQRDREMGRLMQSEQDLINERAKHAAAVRAAADRADPAKIAALRAGIADAERGAKLQQEHRFFLNLPSYPSSYWDQDKASFTAELATMRKQRGEIEQRMAAVKAESSTLARNKITSTKCPTCGQSTVNHEHVTEHNAKIDAQVAALGAEYGSLTAKLGDQHNNIQSMEAVERSAIPYEAAAQRLGELITVDLSNYPPKLQWKGDPPSDISNPAELKKQLDILVEKDRKATLAEGAVVLHASQISKLELGISEGKALLESMVTPEVGPLTERYDEAYQAYAETNLKLRNAGQEVMNIESQISQIDRREKELRDALAHVSTRLTEYRTDLKALAFNNTLVTKLKKLKPSITDHLWNVVLTAVSSFFSTMRGIPSAVTKDSDGFKVNEQPVTSLSGSTLDVLALAIRVALTKTFIPNASFLCLDEPAHGCDTNRTGNVLGFLSSVGMAQTILASHDELSEAVADNVVLLGE